MTQPIIVGVHTIPEVHEGKPVTKGRKYVLRSDVMFNLPGRLTQS